MKNWHDFYDLVMPDLPGCPLAAIDNALRQAAIAFCELSLAWKYGHPPVAVTPHNAEYAFVPPAGAVVHAITHAEFGGREIESRAGESDICIGDWRNQTGAPTYVFGGATALTLVPAPDVSGTLTMSVALKPSPAATGLEDSIFNEYREAVIHGTLAWLMLSLRKPYTSVQLAAYHQQQFAIKTAAAGLRTARNFTRAPLTTSILRRG